MKKIKIEKCKCGRKMGNDTNRYFGHYMKQTCTGCFKLKEVSENRNKW